MNDFGSPDLNSAFQADIRGIERADSNRRSPTASASTDDRADSASADAPRPIPPTQVAAAVTELNDFVQGLQRDLQFEVDAGTAQTVVRVLDRNTGELVRQIPDEVALKLADALRDSGEINMVDDLA